MSTTRATGVGTISGLWAGLLIGALLAVFTTSHAWLAVLLVAAGFGALRALNIRLPQTGVAKSSAQVRSSAFQSGGI